MLEVDWWYIVVFFVFFVFFVCVCVCSAVLPYCWPGYALCSVLSDGWPWLSLCSGAPDRLCFKIVMHATDVCIKGGHIVFLYSP